jgi:HEAT repeat protein
MGRAVGSHEHRRERSSVTEVSAAEAERLIEGAELDVRTALRRLPSAEARARFVDDLAKARRPLVRMWIAWAIPELIGEAGLPVLRRLLADQDADVASAAIDTLLRLDPVAAQRETKRLISWLGSPDYNKPIDALWAIAQVRASEAIPRIETAKGSWSASPWKVRTADIVLDLLRGDEEAILRRIREHDHTDMARLVRAAAIVGTDQAVETLRHVSVDQRVDEHCRSWCARGLQQIATRRSFVN